jgi:uncharacterized protein YndB with AHSA1/START domain
MNVEVQEILVRKNITVDAPLEHVFKVFTEQQDTWWPRSHHIGSCEQFTAMMEPRTGGRWYERGADGSECNWGRVLAWEPPRRLLLAWDINADWKYEEGLGTEVEVSFVPESSERTRVLLEHRKLERYGDKAEMMRSVFESEGAWSGMLVTFAKVAAQPAPVVSHAG